MYKLKKAVNIRLSDYEYNALCKCAYNHHTSLSYIARLAISDYLSKKGYFLKNENY